MIVVSADLASAQDKAKSRSLGVLVIWNDGTGTETVGNYQYEFYSASKLPQPGQPAHPPRITKRGEIKNFRRKRYNVWYLVATACIHALGSSIVDAFKKRVRQDEQAVRQEVSKARQRSRSRAGS